MAHSIFHSFPLSEEIIVNFKFDEVPLLINDITSEIWNDTLLTNKNSIISSFTYFKYGIQFYFI